MLEDVKANVAKLIALYEGEKTRADALAASLSESEEMVKAYCTQIKELNLQIDNLKLLGAMGGGGDTALAKERIEKLIAEMDRCIGLLEN